jgi:hypothetical protein
MLNPNQTTRAMLFVGRKLFEKTPDHEAFDSQSWIVASELSTFEWDQ